MLPWKKNKFELIEEEASKEQAAKRKGYALSLNYCALSSLARACPESALSRVGGMFKSRRKKIRITGEDPTYTVLYLGNATTIQSRGEGCTDAAVGKIWAKSELGKQGTKMRLTVGPQGIRMVHAAEERAPQRRPGHLYLLHRVTYCVADARLPRVFAWVYRHELRHKAVMLRCHAVLVSKPEKARAMALLLYQTSSAALAEFKRLKRRDDARHQQLRGAIPLVPLRKLLLLQGQCCYKPPAERSRSAPKLGSITEDLLGEEEEEEEERRALEELLLHPAAGRGTAESADVEGQARDLEQLISDLGELSIGNDVHKLRADLRVTRLLSGESTGSESSIEEPLANGLQEPEEETETG
ncbi:protein FAM43A [Microcaecilia unicolor]|uniref:Protein FAM43A n=1 Tax=Microcaecilia unicolor TaxID=1415580 RepID=A0A6P7Z997_9AMPH|nr:protein FAM43A [Microcaecilia unicolor]